MGGVWIFSGTTHLGGKWYNVPKTLEVLETIHSISKSGNGICDESQILFL